MLPKDCAPAKAKGYAPMIPAVSGMLICSAVIVNVKLAVGVFGCSSSASSVTVTIPAEATDADTAPSAAIVIDAPETCAVYL